MAKTPPSRSSTRGSKASSKPSSKSALKSGKGSTSRRLVRPPGWYVDRAKKSQAIKAALEARRVIRRPISSSSSDSDSSVDHHANTGVNVGPGVGGVDLEVDPSSPSSPPPPQSPSHNGLNAISSESSSDDEDEDEDSDRALSNEDEEGDEDIDRALSNEGSNVGDEGPHDVAGDQVPDPHEVDEGPRVDVTDRDVDQRPVVGTPGHAGQGGQTQSTPLHLQTRLPSLDISPTEITQGLHTNSG